MTLRVTEISLYHTSIYLLTFQLSDQDSMKSSNECNDIAGGLPSASDKSTQTENVSNLVK